MADRIRVPIIEVEWMIVYSLISWDSQAINLLRN